MILPGLIAGYLAALLAVDTQVDLHGQLVLGGLTWIALVLAARTLPGERRWQVAVVICAATVAELTGSIIWGVYTYRLHNLPTFVPPAHGLVFIAGLSLSQALRAHTRLLVAAAAVIAATWGVLGLTVLPRTDAAGALGVPLLLAFCGARRPVPRTRASSSSSRRSSCTERRSGPGAGRISFPASGFPTATLRAASHPATSGSTSWRC